MNPMANSVVLRKKSIQRYAIFFFANRRRPFAGHNLQLTLTTQGDGSTRSWKLPYFGRPPAAAS